MSPQGNMKAVTDMDKQPPRGNVALLGVIDRHYCVCRKDTRSDLQTLVGVTYGHWWA